MSNGSKKDNRTGRYMKKKSVTLNANRPNVMVLQKVGELEEKEPVA